MTRSRATAKQAGTAFERSIADDLAAKVDDRIDRRAKTGAADKGDIAGLRVHGQRVVVEAKDYGGRILAAEWVREAETERANDGALAGVVVAKRRGTRDPGQQYVLMTMNDLVALINGDRNHIKEN